MKLFKAVASHLAEVRVGRPGRPRLNSADNHSNNLRCLVTVTDKLITRVPTPCVGVCSTGIGDVVCRGCKRFAHEVIHWNGYSDEQKRIIDARLDAFLTQVVATKVRIFDAALLEQQLRAQQIRFSGHKDPHVWVFQLLRAGASQISSPQMFGFALQPAFVGVALADLREQIDREFFVLSEAHYQRYFFLPVNNGALPDSLSSNKTCDGTPVSVLDVC